MPRPGLIQEGERSCGISISHGHGKLVFLVFYTGYHKLPRNKDNSGAIHIVKREHLPTWEIEVNLGLLDVPDQFVPAYELWVKRREGWLPEFVGLGDMRGSGGVGSG